MSEQVVIIALRSSEDEKIDPNALAKRVEMMTAGAPKVEAIHRDYDDLTANDHSYLRKLGFSFDQANRIMTVVWTK